MTGKPALFLFVFWEKARDFAASFRADVAGRFTIRLETEVYWPHGLFTKKLADFYGWQDRFCWWNKARKCGRGPFRVFLIEDPAPVWHPHRDTSGRIQMADDSVYRLKCAYRARTGRSNIVHSSVTREETDAQCRVLFGLPAAACAAQPSLPTADSLEAQLAAGALPRIGDGSRRVCYRVPDTDFCLKSYRTDDDMTTSLAADGSRRPFHPAPAVVREIRTGRFDERANVNCREWRFHQELGAEMPDEVRSVFPARVSRIMLPSHGWSLLETLIANADGSPARTVEGELRRGRHAPSFRTDLRRALERLRDLLVCHAVPFYDPPNVLVQNLPNGSFALRIADFEPADRTLIPIDTLCPRFVRMKVRRRFDRFLKRMMLTGSPA